MSNLDIAAEVSLQLALRERRVAKGWSFRPGVVMFPEVRCPYCSSVVKSTAIWLLSQTQLLGQGVPRHGREFKLDSQRHPHAIGSTGDICFGDAVDAMTALFGGLNPDSTYFDMAEWLQGRYWSHSCEEMDKGYRCESCGDRLSEDEGYNFSGSSYCSNCFSEVAFNCWSCGGDYSIDAQYSSPDGESYCHRCWSRNWFKCYGCDESTSHDDQMTGADDEAYCSSCWSDEFFSCSDCGDTFRSSDAKDTDDGAHCADCFADKYFTCSNCDDVCKLGDQRGDEGECVGCYLPPADDEDESSEESDQQELPL